MRLCARGTVKKTPYQFGSIGIPAVMVNWLSSPGGTRHRTNKVRLIKYARINHDSCRGFLHLKSAAL
ncbi:hypothetical protein EM822_21305 [Salmonella enterica subsp. enterica serovar Oranienburg]|nr:hypothetical protein [Salmonella enterica subsp. enterica serovar Oranienburg]